MNLLDFDALSQINLVVTDITAPATVASGQTVSLSWTVENQGTISTISNYWYDTVFYSTDEILGNGDDIYLNGFFTDYNNLPLDPNQSYTVTQDITVPNYITGQGYLLINTDSYNDQAENNETDNVKSVAINVTTPDVNLVVTDITTPNIVASGHTFSLSWTVQNQGTTSTTSNSWYDTVFYSTDEILGNGDDIYLNGFSTDYNNLPLDPNQSYTVTQNITVPNTLTGQGYLLIKTDGYDWQVETNETDNVKSVAISIVPPDVNLVATEITAPSSVATGQSFNVSWTVQNQGMTSTISNYWYDTVFYSTDEILGNGDDIYLNGFSTDYNNLPLDSNESYTISRSVILPSSIINSGYLLVKTDGYDGQVETNETDNVKSVAISIVPPDVNLVATEITAPSSVAIGQSFDVFWTVQNQGQQVTNSNSWVDRLVYSTDEIFGNDDDIYLGESSYSSDYHGNLGANATYSNYGFITLPPQITESGYLLLKTNYNNNQTETNETDNIKSVSIAVTHPQDNLVVNEITVPESPKFGQKISLSWTVQNQGTETTTSSSWNDTVVYSADEIFGNEDDIYLGGSFNYNSNLNISPYPDYFTFVPPVNPNETYTITKDITLPTQGPENGYLLVKTDSYNSQPETNETDNVKSVAITLTQPKANFVVTEITAPTAVLPGQFIPLAWTVQNQGTEPTTASNWIDRVVYSTDEIFGNEDDIYLTESWNRNYVLGGGWHNIDPNDNYVPILNPNETYTIIHRDFATVPSEMGNGYLLVKTDVNNNQVETDETDNVKAVPITITKPNLVVTDITAPTSVTNGETISVSWTVQNQGSIATNPSFSNGSIGIGYLSNWSDSIVYSADDIFGNEDDVNLPIDFLNSHSSLAPNETYTTNLNIPITNDIAGQGYLLVKTDVENSLGETDETDNIKSVAINISINSAPTGLSLNANSVKENQSVDTLIGNFTTTDANTADTFTYSLISGTGDTDNNLFTIVGNQLKTNAIFDYESQSSYSIRVKTTDQEELSYEQSFTINITDVSEITGTVGNDILLGTPGDDVITGLKGSDVITGGDGNDEFVYNRLVDARDILKDFTVGSDKINFSKLLDKLNYQGDNPILDCYVQFSGKGSNTMIKIDPDGALGSAKARSFLFVENVAFADLNDASNFIF